MTPALEFLSGCHNTCVPNFLPLLNTCHSKINYIVDHLNLPPQLTLNSKVCSSEVSVSSYISIEITYRLDGT